MHAKTGFINFVSSIYNKGSGPPPSGPQKGSHVDKQLGMHVETLPRRQTTLYACLDDSPGRAAASPRPEPLRPQASIARASGMAPTPTSPGAHLLKKWVTANIPIQAICLRTQHMQMVDLEFNRALW